MNSEETKKFLNFVQALLPTDPFSIYYSKENDGNDYYYFYTGLNCELKIRSMGNDINFLFKAGIKGTHKETNNISVDLSFEDAKPILEQCFQAWQKRKMDDFLFHNDMTIADVKKDLDFINSYLQVTDLSQKFKAQQENVNLILKSPNETEYEVRVGRLYKEFPEKKNILHVCEIPVVFHKRGPKGHVYIDHVIPGWDIAKYKALKPVLAIDNGIDSLQDLSDKLKEISPDLGTFYLASTLSQDLVEKKSTVKALKL